MDVMIGQALFAHGRTGWILQINPNWRYLSWCQTIHLDLGNLIADFMLNICGTPLTNTFPIKVLPIYQRYSSSDSILWKLNLWKKQDTKFHDARHNWHKSSTWNSSAKATPIFPTTKIWAPEQFCKSLRACWYLRAKARNLFMVNR